MNQSFNTITVVIGQCQFWSDEIVSILTFSIDKKSLSLSYSLEFLLIFFHVYLFSEIRDCIGYD